MQPGSGPQPRSSLRHSPAPAFGTAPRGAEGGAASGPLAVPREEAAEAARPHRAVAGFAPAAVPCRLLPVCSRVGHASPAPTALPAPLRALRPYLRGSGPGAALEARGCHGNGPAVIDGSDRQSAPCSANPPPRRPLQGCPTEELPVPACCAREPRRRRDCGVRGMMGSVGDRRRQPGHPRTPAQASPRCCLPGSAGAVSS